MPTAAGLYAIELLPGVADATALRLAESARAA